MKVVYPLFALALFGAVATDALRVESTDVAPPADILGEHQELEKTFSVYSEEALEKLSIAIAGPVFITHDTPAAAVAPVVATPEPTSTEPTTEEPATTEPATPEPTTVEPAAATETPEPTTETPTSTPTVTPAATVLIDTDSSLDGSSDGSSSSSGSGSSSSSGSNDTIEFPAIDAVRSLNAASHREETLVATITISGNSSALLDLVEIVPTKKGANNAIRLTYKNTDASAEGFVLTTIQVVEKHALRHLSASVASTVDVASGVLSKEVKEKKIKISSAGASSVFITEDAAIVAQEMDVDVAGSGNVQIVCAASLQLETQLSASVAGSGVVAIHAASIETNELKTSAAGSGSLFVVADTLSAFELSSSVYGSSFASFVAALSGAAQKEKLTIAGSGAVYAGSVVANKSSVDVYGSGVAYVRATEKLKSSSSRSASVYYVGDKPRVVKTSGWFFWRSSVEAAPENKMVTHAVVASPRVYPTYVALSLTKTHRADEPMVVTVDKSNPQEQGQSVNFALLTTHLATVAHGPNGFLVFGSVAAALVAVALVAQSYQQHRQRRHYMPLV